MDSRRRTVGYVLLGLTIALIVGCAFSRSTSVDGSRVRVFSAGETERSVHWLERCVRAPGGDVTATWTPSTQDTSGVEEQLRLRLTAELGAADPRLEAEDYFLQYFGVVRDGTRRIFVNGFHEAVMRTMAPPSFDWRGRPLVICDSRFGSFQIEFDIGSRSLGVTQFF